VTFIPDRWQRENFGGVPIYFNRDRAGWFVPNRSGDHLLANLKADGEFDLDATEKQFLAVLPQYDDATLPKKVGGEQPYQLTELWLHLTDRCNLRCNHCLFSSSPENRAQISFESLERITEQATALGCRKYILTGGEPLMHPDFERIVDLLLQDRESEVVVQTNGTLLRQSGAAFRRWASRPFRLQIGIDGLQDNHDRIRGEGSFVRLTEDLERLTLSGVPYSLLMSVDTKNVDQMADLVDLAAIIGASHIEYMWYVVRGRGVDASFCSPERLHENFIRAANRAEGRGISIGNLESLRRKVFVAQDFRAPAGINSAALSPDGALYPGPALVWLQEMAISVRGDLKRAWNEGEVFRSLRENWLDAFQSPLKYYHGGGMPEHSYLSSGSLLGNDPYLPLYEKTILWLIATESSHIRDGGPPAIRLKMGDRKLRN
jgi:MoaA/NifB/PqqE/SkfB family radical SAM enzyme